eukprot:TRINITY_DN27735_c0_g1_i2.p2 TRINITY_DN27735_c0_g1~~TRINITY_DN27735_c0_g1_i2.p2  ORF type:complete len:213 (+),score=15.53 TRINITY_DN27735_c0_g1_i2:135-773(+)
MARAAHTASAHAQSNFWNYAAVATSNGHLEVEGGGAPHFHTSLMPSHPGSAAAATAGAAATADAGALPAHHLPVPGTPAAVSSGHPVASGAAAAAHPKAHYPPIPGVPVVPHSGHAASVAAPGTAGAAHSKAVGAPPQTAGAVVQHYSLSLGAHPHAPPSAAALPGSGPLHRPVATATSAAVPSVRHVGPPPVSQHSRVPVSPGARGGQSLL